MTLAFLRCYLLSVIIISRITPVTNARCSSNERARECERIENANPFLPKPRALHLYKKGLPYIHFPPRFFISIALINLMNIYSFIVSFAYNGPLHSSQFVLSPKI